MLENFEPDDPPYRYGDVLFFTDPQGRAQAPACVRVGCPGPLEVGGGAPPPWTPQGSMTTAERSFSRPLEDP